MNDFSFLDSPPGVQDSLVFGQLPPEGRVWLSDAPFLLDKVVGFLQGPTVLLHGVSDNSRGRPAHPHLTVHQALGIVLPGTHFKGYL